jgi:hypothetical protein
VYSPTLLAWHPSVARGFGDVAGVLARGWPGLVIFLTVVTQWRLVRSVRRTGCGRCHSSKCVAGQARRPAATPDCTMASCRDPQRAPSQPGLRLDASGLSSRSAHGVRSQPFDAGERQTAQ